MVADGSYTGNKSGGRGGVYAINRIYSGAQLTIRGSYVGIEAATTGGVCVCVRACARECVRVVCCVCASFAVCVLCAVHTCVSAECVSAECVYVCCVCECNYPYVL